MSGQETSVLVEVNGGVAAITRGASDYTLVVDWDNAAESLEYAQELMGQLWRVHPEDALRISRTLRREFWPDEL